jgi:hypothetical protein
MSLLVSSKIEPLTLEIDEDLLDQPIPEKWSEVLTKDNIEYRLNDIETFELLKAVIAVKYNMKYTLPTFIGDWKYMSVKELNNMITDGYVRSIQAIPELKILTGSLESKNMIYKVDSIYRYFYTCGTYDRSSKRFTQSD